MFHKFSTCAAILGIAAAVVGATQGAAQDTAHSVADRFASEAERAEARREARRKAEAKKQQPADKAAPDRKPAEARKRPAETDRYAYERRRKEEMEMLARARREAEEMQAAEETRRLIEAAEQERAKAEELLAKDGALDAAPAAKAVDAQPAKVPDDAARREQAAALERAEAQEATRATLERAARTHRLTASLKRVREIREARLAAAERRVMAERKAELETASARLPPPASAPAVPVITVAEGQGKAAPAERTVEAPAARAADAPVARTADTPAAGLPPTYTPAAGRETTFAVLLSMQAGSRGIRRFNKKADPVLCTLDGCFVSGGAGQAAVYMPGRKAMGFINTWGKRAGACRGKLSCVFRGIDVGELPGFLRPVDLRVMLHDRRLGQVISRDSDCRSTPGRLTCASGIYADSYAMWVVPESIAEAAGAEALEKAVADGLDAPRSAELAPRR